MEINGHGGLGKTELLYQFLRRHIKGEYDPAIPAFDHYIILTAKSEEQGEVDTINSTGGPEGLVTTSPLDSKHGPRDYVHELKFRDVIRIINTYDPICEDLDSIENAQRLFKEGNVLMHWITSRIVHQTSSNFRTSSIMGHQTSTTIEDHHHRTLPHVLRGHHPPPTSST